MAQQSPDGEPAIGVADFFSLACGARSVGDGHLRNVLAHTAELGRYFRAKLESTASQSNLRQQRPAKNFVAGGFIVNARAVEQVGEVGE